jgi:hypothetical protein
MVRPGPSPTGTTRASTPIAGIRTDTGRLLPAAPVGRAGGAASRGRGPASEAWQPTTRRHPASTAPQPQAANLGLRRRDPG